MSYFFLSASDILLKHRTLAKNSILTEYDEKKRRKLDRQEGYREGLELGMERGIEALVLDNLEAGIDDNHIVNKLMLRFQLNEEKAKDYIKKYK